MGRPARVEARRLILRRTSFKIETRPGPSRPPGQPARRQPIRPQEATRPWVDRRPTGFMVLCRAITFDLSDDLVIAAEKRAAELRRPLRALVEEGLRAQLADAQPVPTGEVRTIRRVTVDGGLPAGVDVGAGRRYTNGCAGRDGRPHRLRERDPGDLDPRWGVHPAPRPMDPGSALAPDPRESRRTRRAVEQDGHRRRSRSASIRAPFASLRGPLPRDWARSAPTPSSVPSVSLW